MTDRGPRGVRYRRAPMFAVGSRVDRFELVAKLGQGGQGSVWSAVDLVDGGSRALKLVPLLGVKEATRERMRREARALSTISHPGIVRCHGLFESFDPGVLGLVLELVSGRSLEQSLDDPRLDRAHRELVLEHLADALAHLHDRGLVHRDLKPANVMVANDFWSSPRAPGCVKLVDFGIAVREHEERRVTEDGHFIGTVPYVPPESMDPRQFHGSALSPRVDVFALGVLASVLLVGRHPTGLALGATAVEFVSAYRAGLAAPLDEAVPRALSACWEPVAERRPATAGDVLRALRAATAPSSTTGARTEPTPVPAATRATATRNPARPEPTVPAAPLPPPPVRQARQAPAAQHRPEPAGRGGCAWALVVLAALLVLALALVASVGLLASVLTYMPRSTPTAPPTTAPPTVPAAPPAPPVAPTPREAPACCPGWRTGGCFQEVDARSCQQPIRGRVRLRLHNVLTSIGPLQQSHPRATVSLRAGRASVAVPIASARGCGASELLELDPSELTSGISVTVVDGSRTLFSGVAAHRDPVLRSAICKGLIFSQATLRPRPGSSLAVTRLEFVLDQ